jgi:hypothetical protein
MMRWRWMVWDALAILAFTLIGMYFHRQQIVWGDIWYTLLPLYGGWFGLGLLLGLYRASAARWVFPLVWLLGVLIGLMLRAWWRGVPPLAIDRTFLILSLLFIGLFTGVPRLLVALLRLYLGRVRKSCDAGSSGS